jgi:hypothetical protein
MLIATRRRRSYARFSAAVAVAAALVLALIGVPATASASTMGVPNASGRVSPGSLIANGVYRWQNAGGGWCLAYNVENRGFARQESCSTTDDYTVFWNAVNISGNNYELVNEHNGTCLTVYGDTTANGAGVFIYQCGYTGANTTDQIFTLIPQTSPLFAGAYQLQNVRGGLCLAVAGASRQQGASIIMWSCAQSGEFMWRPLN